MSFHLTESFPHNWSPFRHRFNNRDMPFFRNLDVSDPMSHTVPTVEPSYSYESDNSHAHFEIELPGVAKEDVSVDINAHKLIVKGRRFKKEFLTEDISQEGNGTSAQVKQEEQNAQQHVQVEQTTTPERKPSLIYLLEARVGHGADLDAIHAKHHGDGIMSIHIPMKTEKQARRITIGS